MIVKRIALALLMLCGLQMAASAALVRLGQANGGLMVYYNNIDVSGAGGVPDGIVSGYDERPDNQAYIQAQISEANTRGMAFQFDSTDLGGFNWNDIFSGQPVGQSQFGLDMMLVAPTYNGAGGVVIPSVKYYDNTDNTVAGAVGMETALPAFAINGYHDPAGPAAGGSPINSLFRGNAQPNALTMVTNSVTPTQTGWQIQVSGWLITDGLMNWYNPAFGSTPLAAWGFTNRLFYEGTLDYNMIGDAGQTQSDFYGGQFDVYLEQTEPVVPEPATLSLLGLGLVGGALARRRSRKA